MIDYAQIQALGEPFTRTWAEVDLTALCDNFQAAKDYAASYGAETLAVVKANAYGHGAKRVTAELTKRCQAKWFAVASLEEALELCNGGITASILILSEVHPSLYPELCRRPNIITSIFRKESAKLLSMTAEKENACPRYFFAVDTGMSRIGLECTSPEKTEAAVNEIADIYRLPHIECAGIFSHLACADEADKTNALLQVARFNELLSKLKQNGIEVPIRSLCNSAAMTEPAFADKYDLVRDGIWLYGLAPSEEIANRLHCRPVFCLKSRITNIKTVDAGIGVSYGATYVTSKPTRIATIPCGYADGYPRLLSNRAAVLIHGRYAPILGHICMDQMMADVTDIPEAVIDDEVTLMGGDGEVSVNHLAKLMGTIGYELLCSIALRVPRVYR